MIVTTEKDEKLATILESISSVVGDKYYYIPGWFEITKGDRFIFHHMNKLPKELTDLVEKTRNPKTDNKP